MPSLSLSWLPHWKMRILRHNKPKYYSFRFIWKNQLSLQKAPRYCNFSNSKVPNFLYLHSLQLSKLSEFLSPHPPDSIRLDYFLKKLLPIVLSCSLLLQFLPRFNFCGQIEISFLAGITLLSDWMNFKNYLVCFDIMKIYDLVLRGPSYLQILVTL